MSPTLLLTLLIVGLLALPPVWRLRVAGWPPRWLLAAWLVIAIAAFLVIRVPGPARFLLPLLVLAYVAPFVAGPERLTRVLGGRDGRSGGGGVIIDVTPRLKVQPPHHDGSPSVGDDATAAGPRNDTPPDDGPAGDGGGRPGPDTPA